MSRDADGRWTDETGCKRDCYSTGINSDRYRLRMADVLNYIQAGCVKLEHIEPTWRDRLYRLVHRRWPRELARQEYWIRKRNADRWIEHMRAYKPPALPAPSTPNPSGRSNTARG